MSVRRVSSKTTLTHCPFCALNCGLGLEADAGVIDTIRWKRSPLSQGALCAKGAQAAAQVRHPDRLTEPLVRIDGTLRPTSWEVALDRAAAGFSRIRAELGPDANAMLGGSSLTNEKTYLIGKFARLALGTRHVDYNGRLCMATAGMANRMAFGLDRAMTPLAELDRADAVVVIGANLSASYPVVIPQAIDRLRARGGRVVVVDPRGSRFVAEEDCHIALRPGTDAIVANAILNEIGRNGWSDESWLERRTRDAGSAFEAAAEWTVHRAAAAADVPVADLAEAARIIGTSDRVMYLHARGSEHHVTGVQNVLAWINIALARGHVGRPGCGIDMLTGQRNGQGGREMGQKCDQLPGARDIDDPRHRQEVASAWGIDVDSLPRSGVSFVDILNLAGSGEVRGLLVMCTNPAVSAPNHTRALESLRRLEHLVVIDPFLSETAAMADVVLPGTTFAEESGTVTTIEGRVVRCDEAVAPLPRRNDIDVIRALAGRLGAERRHFDFHRGQEVFEEIRRVTRGAPADYSGMTWEAIREKGGLFWPCPDGSGGTPQLYVERFAHDDGLARLHAVVPEAPPEPTSEELPLILTTGRVLSQYLTGNQTRRIDALNRRASAPVLEVHPDTAAAFELVTEERVVIVSRYGRSTVDWIANPELRADTLFLPFHWAEANALVGDALDPRSRMPGFKHTSVRIEPDARRCGDPEREHRAPVHLSGAGERDVRRT